MSQQHVPTQSQQYRQPAADGQPGATTGGSQSSARTTGGGATQQPAPVAGTQGAAQDATSGPVGRQFRTRSYLSQQVRTTSIGMLNQCLADLSAVTMQLKNGHWNVKGIHFYQLHELFEDVAATLEAHIDTVAERASALGGEALGTARDVAACTTIPALPRGVVDGETLLAKLADRLATLDAAIGQQIETADEQGDPDTADLLNEVSRDVSKALWFVEAHLQGSPRGGHRQTAGGTASGGGHLTELERAEFGHSHTSPDSEWEATGLQ